MIANACCLRDGYLPVRMKELVAAGWAHENRRIVFRAEKLNGHVDLRNIVESARAQLELQETLSIGTQRDLVVKPRGHVAEMRWRHLHSGHWLEIENVDRLFWILDELLGFQRRPNDRIGQFVGCCRSLDGEGR